MKWHTIIGLACRLAARWSAEIIAILFLCSAAPGLSYTVSFDQIDWLNTSGGYTDYQSDWGFATFQLSSADASLLQSTSFGYLGYLNIVTTVSGGASDNWAVQNLPLWFTSLGEMDMQTTYGLTFDLGITAGSGRVSSLDYYLTISSDPLASLPTGSQTSASVGVANWLFGGAGDISGQSGNTGESSPGGAVNFIGASPDRPAVAGGSINVAQSNIVAVTEDLNGCVPGATTRSLFYLQSNGLAGFGGSVSNVYQTLVTNMHTSIGTNGAGTTFSNFLNGKNLWLQSNGVSLVTTTTTNLFDALRSLTNGADIEARIFWSSNGHRAFVSSITVYSNGSYTLGIIDSAQNGNTTNRIWNLTVDSNGLSNLGPNTRVSFVVEVPEPSPVVLVAASLLTLVAIRFRKRC